MRKKQFVAKEQKYKIRGFINPGNYYIPIVFQQWNQQDMKKQKSKSAQHEYLKIITIAPDIQSGELVFTIYDKGWQSKKNGALLQAINEKGIDFLMTADRNHTAYRIRLPGSIQ